MMPVYNGEKTLERAISSILHQTYFNWKCYIFNDGSTDGTKNILDSLTDPRFVILNFNRNRGRPWARQAILDVVEGDYLGFLDSDDFLHPEKLRLQVEILSKTSVSLVSCGNACFGENNKIQSKRGEGHGKKENYKMGTMPKMAMRTSLVLLSLAKEINFDQRLKYAQDTDFLIKYLSIGKSFIIQDQILYYYSEYNSVSKNKILITNFYGLIVYKQFFKTRPLFAIARVLITISKIIMKILVYPFVDAEFYLSKRGKAPNLQDIQNYNDTLELVATENKLI